MIFYYQPPFEFFPHTSSSWTPYMIATSPTTSCQRRYGCKKQKLCNLAQTPENASKIIYQDRNTRIQHVDDNKVEFSFDMPGIKASDTNIEIRDGVLKVNAERIVGGDRTTKFERSFLIKEFADTESEDLHATLQDGVLCITIPKKVSKDIAEAEIKSSPIPVVAEYPPETNESDAETRVRFSVNLPGVPLSNVTLNVKNDTISLLATRKLFDKESTTKKQFTVDTDKVDITSFNGYLVDGVLTIIGSKKALPGPKKIVITDVSDGLANMRIENAAESKEESKEEEDMVIVETVAEEANKE